MVTSAQQNQNIDGSLCFSYMIFIVLIILQQQIFLLKKVLIY